MEMFRDQKADIKLLRAVANNNIKKAGEASDQGAYYYIRYENGDTLLHRAVINKNIKMINFLMTNEKVDMRHLKNKKGKTPYQESINIEGNEEIDKKVYYKFFRFNKN